MFWFKCHNFYESGFIEHVVIEIDCFASNESKLGANGMLILSNKIIHTLSNGRKAFAIGFPALEVDEDLVEHFASAVITRFVTVGNQTNLPQLAKLLCTEVA